MTDPLDSSDIRHGSKIGRFVVEGQLGAGAMGVVYTAHDRELDRRVALKVLKGAGDQEALVRLQREGQAMARVTHPNVITVHEAGIQGRLVFLAQELLDGGSLRQWLEQPHSQREILDKFVAAGRGLAAAHKAGLVHRDFKPDNVLLGKDGRVRVSDFGLARSLAGLETMPVQPRDPNSVTKHDIANSPMATMTRTGAVMGTPLYMSPEQHRGEPADERSDQFSFSVALYQALYGDQPFPGKTVVALADAVIGGRMQPPPKSSKVPAHLRKILLRGLANDPKQRYPSMDALLEDLTHDPARKRRRALVGVGIAVLVLGAVAGGYVLSLRQNAGPVVPKQRTIAVLELKNLSGDKNVAWMSSAVGELLVAELGKGDDVRITRDRAGSDVVLTGSVQPNGDQVTVRVVVDDLVRKKTKSIEKTGPATDLVTLAAQAGTEVREALGISTIGVVKQSYAVLPKDPEAARTYIEGNEALKKNDFANAKKGLLASTKKEPDFAPSYIALSDAYAGSFEFENAKNAARQALEHVKTLGLDQGQLVAGQAHERLGERDKAREQYRRLFATTQRLDHGIALLRVETPEDLVATLGSVRKLGADPRIDLIEGRAALDKANAQRALDLAQAAAKAAPAGIRHAQAKQLEGEAQLALGNLGAAADALEAARKIFDEANDKVSRLAVMELIAGVSLDRGQLDDAYGKFDNAAQVRLGASQKELASIAFSSAAYAAAVRGRIADADKQLREADKHKGQDPYAMAYVDLATSVVAWAKGDIDTAKLRSDQCAARFAVESMRLLCQEINGYVRAEHGDPGARKTFDDALETAEKSQNAQRSNSLQLALAMLDLDDGQEALAIGRAQTVAEEAAKRGSTSLEAHAWITLARAHWMQAESQKALADLEHVKAEPQALRVRVQYKIYDGLTHHSLGDADAAMQKIEAVRAETEKQTCIGLNLETRLAKSQVLATEEGKAELDAVLRDAKARNFGRIVKLAESLAQPSP